MSSVLARQRAAQAWCEPNTENITMIPELAFAFADIIEDIWNKQWIDNATKRELIDELKARIEIDGKLDYRTAEEI